MLPITPVLLSGGSGTRLWPVSRSLHPKQLLALNSELTLFEETAKRFANAPGFAAPIVVANDEHRFIVAAQLQGLGINNPTVVLEPIGRNTTPAAAVAALILQERTPNSLMLLAASDHVILDVEGLIKAVRDGAPAAKDGYLVTFGIKPNRPETGYGYIDRGEPLPGVPGAFAVQRFVEKPDRATAERFLTSGNFLWNASLFLFSPDTFLKELSLHAPDVLEHATEALRRSRRDLDFLRLDGKAFAACPSISIDYAVMERTSKAAVIPADIGWSDIGSWSKLWELKPKDANGNVLQGNAIIEQGNRNFIRSDKVLVAALGIDDLVIVATPDAILVTRKERDQDIKTLVDRLQKEGRSEASQPARVYRPWGFFEGLYRGENCQVKLIEVNPGASLSLQLHHKRAEHWVVVQGEAEIVRGTESITLQQNESTFIPIGMQHRLENKRVEPLRLIEVQIGSYLGEDDIVRLKDRYKRSSDI